MKTHPHRLALAILAPLLMLALWPSEARSAITPGQIMGWLEPNVLVLMLLWGVVVKYLPALAKWPNELIGWVNLIGFVLAKLGGAAVASAALPGPVADATMSFADALAAGVLHSGSAMILYELFGRGLLERVLGLKKAVPRGSPARA